jgi:hypothetical protein
MGSCSKGLRPKVLAATDRGGPRRGEAVGAFGISLAILKRWPVATNYPAMLVIAALMVWLSS